MDRLFVLPQRDVIYVCHSSNYGKVAESRRPTTDDKVRAVGISMTNSDIRELIPDMLGKTKGGTRSLDAAASKSCQRFHLLHAKFVDKEVVVTLPVQWEDPEIACKVDERLGAGIFEEHSQFDPNNYSKLHCRG